MIPRQTKKMVRPQISQADMDAGFRFLNKRFKRARNRKGQSSFSSIHEILGKVTEEYYETVEAVHKGDRRATELELADVAIAAIWGIMCIRAKKVD